jgi:hypothetical protein
MHKVKTKSKTLSERLKEKNAKLLAVRPHGVVGEGVGEGNFQEQLSLFGFSDAIITPEDRSLKEESKYRMFEFCSRGR